ncbi:DUF5916 domain-containing protein [Jiulongibacter sediminis]|uniref:DUF5916 domain-containing protein n=1 Tax=Jiulongibacter sediminis TaxID=1605367 RepID=UPI000ABC9FA8|nr:DUF5916 domain-containing protein [Jiulongibacter sediminis]
MFQNTLTSKYLFAAFLLLSSIAKAQDDVYQVKYDDGPVKLDGKLSEPRWVAAKAMQKFTQLFPSDSLPATYQTEIFLSFDDKNIYVGAIMRSENDQFIVPTLQRDFRAGGSDNVTFIFDTFQDNTNAFLFGTNPMGVRREALLSNGAVDNSFFNRFWDNKWAGEAFIGENYWSCELVIPLSTLRYKKGSQNWNFKAYRFDTQSGETSVLVRQPQNQIPPNLGYSLPITFEKPLPNPGRNVSLIPYATASYSKDVEEGGPAKKGAGIGGDAKIGITSGLNLDLTVNPDFSTVEADQQIINLTRFDVTFPEQRQFFLENSDLFTTYGSFNLNPFVPPGAGRISGGNDQIFTPFFTRKVGIAFDSTTGTNVQSRILYGARLSGKLDDNWRVGVLNTMTAGDEDLGIDAANYTVATLQRRVFQRSNVSAIFVNNQLGTDPESQNVFNRVAGLEFNLNSINTKWQGKAFYHQSFDSKPKDDAYAHGITLNYITRGFVAKWQHDIMGAGFDAVSGFVPRSDFTHINPTFGFNRYPREGALIRWSYGFAWDQYFKPGIGSTDLKAGPFLAMNFRNTSSALVSVNQNYTYLFADFDALRSNKELPVLKEGSGYKYYSLETTYVTDRRKKLTAAVRPMVGGYFNGNILSLNTSFTYRLQPYMLTTLNVAYNKIDLEEGSNTVFVVGPRVEVTFNRKLFWTTFVQYNTQFDNLNVNSRLQWRFAPVSDFFLVYSDNYNTNLGGLKNRAIVAKLTYWLNL